MRRCDKIIMKKPLIKNTIEAVLFDLDGTLIDTAPDMALALNIQLEKHGKNRLGDNKIRPWVSHGAAALLKIGFGIEQNNSDFDSMRQEYLEIYSNNLSVKSQPFAGIEELIAKLDDQSISWGVVTNKPEYLAAPLMESFEFSQSMKILIGGDTVKPAKPSPKPLFVACKKMQCIPTKSIYIGDAERDITAGNAAGMLTVLAQYGYITAQDRPEQWQADLSVDSAQDISSLLF